MPSPSPQKEFLSRGSSNNTMKVSLLTFLVLLHATESFASLWAPHRTYPCSCLPSPTFGCFSLRQRLSTSASIRSEKTCFVHHGAQRNHQRPQKLQILHTCKTQPHSYATNSECHISTHRKPQGPNYFNRRLWLTKLYLASADDGNGNPNESIGNSTEQSEINSNYDSSSNHQNKANGSFTSQSIDANESENELYAKGTREDREEDFVMGMESGWTNFARQLGGRYLLPSPSKSTSVNENNVQSTNDKVVGDGGNSSPNASESTGSSLVFPASTLSNNNGTDVGTMDGNDVIDVGARVESSAISKRVVLRKALLGAVKALFRGGKMLVRGSNDTNQIQGTISRVGALALPVGEDSPVKITGSTSVENTTRLLATANNAGCDEETPSNEYFGSELQLQDNSTSSQPSMAPAPLPASDNFNIDSTNQTLVESNQIRSRRGRRRRSKEEGNMSSSNSFLPTSLFRRNRSRDVASRKEKWKRRSAVLIRATQNAVFLFVVTFFAGNLMNQFVDLDENGSFEVRFGNVLSSPSPSPTPSSPRSGSTLFRTASSTNQRYTDGGKAHAMSLVTRSVRNIGPAVVRVETETDLDAEGNEVEKEKMDDNQKKNTNGGTNGESSNGEDGGDVFDGVPEAPPDNRGKNTDFGQGSGIIFNEDGYILTNAHVVDGATRVYVLLTDGRRFRAELKGSDDIVDVAVLKISPETETVDALPVAQLGNSDYLDVGRFVVAVGSPGGLDNTCTIGIVSGLKRCPKVVGIPDKFGVLDYIQTDAAINQGNSGGPLVDVESGEIIGINTCIRANMEGTSFAIPINKVMGIVEDLAEGKHVTHGYLGVHMSTINPSLAKYFNRAKHVVPEKDGVIIEKVFKNSPARIGGLKQYDFVTEIGGQRVEKADDAHVIIDRSTIGEELSITFIRDESEQTVQVKPEDLSPHLKQLREERLRRKKLKTKQ